MNLKTIPYQSKLVFVDKLIGNLAYHTEGGIEDVDNKSAYRFIPKAKIICQEVGLNLEGIPYVKLEEDVEELADNFVKSQKPTYRSLERDGWVATGFVAGYKAAQPKRFTEEQVRQAVAKAIDGVVENFDSDGDHYGVRSIYTVDEIIQSLKPKIESIEIETYINKYTHKNCINKCGSYPSKCLCEMESKEELITYQEDGNTFVKLIKINYQ